MRSFRIGKAASLVLTAALLACVFVTSCAGKKPASYKDGTYTGRSSDFNADESGNGAGYGEVEITVKDNKIVGCTFKMYELDGKLKDENYGSDLSAENRLKAQKAVQSAERYAALLVAKGSVEDVDAISGATISYNEFTEAVKNALAKAV